MVNILNMVGWTVLQLDERPGEYRVTAQPTHPPTSCPACGSGQLYRFGTRPELIMDLPMHGKRVGIQAQRRRFRCRSCSQTFVEPTPGVDSQHRATVRLVDWIAQQSLSRTFTNVADEIGLNEITVRRIFAEHVEVLNKDWERKVETPARAGASLRSASGILKLEAENAALRSAIEEPVPDLEPGSRDGRDRCCRLCGWDVAPSAPSDHEPSCPLAAPPRELGQRIVKELAERRRLGDAMAEAVEAGLGYVPMKAAADAWRALGRREVSP